MSGILHDGRLHMVMTNTSAASLGRVTGDGMEHRDTDGMKCWDMVMEWLDTINAIRNLTLT